MKYWGIRDVCIMKSLLLLLYQGRLAGRVCGGK